MRAVVAHDSGVHVPDIQQAVMGAGFDCTENDCVSFEQLSTRLAEGEVDMIFVRSQEQGGSVPSALQEARTLTDAPLVAIGPGDEASRRRAQRFGIEQYVDEENLRDNLDAVIELMVSQQGFQPAARGVVISIFAPLTGSGGTTIAANVAGTLARRKCDTGLIELAREFGDLAFLLDMKPEMTVEQTCARWRALDATSLRNSFTAHSSGLNVLLHDPDMKENPELTREAARRMAVLSRMAFDYTVMALDSRLEETELDVMRLSDSVGLVVRPDVPSVRRAAWAVDYAVQNGVERSRFRLVVNRWGQSGQLSLKDIERTLDLKAVQRIRNSPGNINRAANRGNLVHQVSRFSGINRQFGNLALALNGRKLKRRQVQS